MFCSNDIKNVIYFFVEYFINFKNVLQNTRRQNQKHEKRSWVKKVGSYLKIVRIKRHALFIIAYMYIQCVRNKTFTQSVPFFSGHTVYNVFIMSTNKWEGPIENLKLNLRFDFYLLSISFKIPKLRINHF